MRRNNERKPTLRSSFMAHNSIAAAVAMFIMLLIVVFFADRAALSSVSKALVSDLEQAETAEDFAGRFKGRGSKIVLDPDGMPVSQVQGGGFGIGRGQAEQSGKADLSDPSAVWSRSHEVVAAGSLEGYGELPWTDGSVLWAAKSVLSSDGQTRVIVIWEKAGSVRAQGWPFYVIGISGVMISFMLNLLFSNREATRISLGLKEVAESGRRMADGDFEVDLPDQEILELDQIGRSLNGLALSLKSANTELKKEAVRLEQLERTQKRFIADASHEIRAPLATMAITLDAWKDGLLSEDEKAGAMGRIRTEITRLSDLAEQLLDLSKIESGRLIMEMKPIDAAKVAASVIDAYKGTPGAEISLKLVSPLPKVMADEQGLHRMIRNLLDNSKRFTTADGNIEVELRLCEGMVRIEVRDDGIGIPKAELSHMWDRFARAERDRSAGRAGTGLGLAIVKALSDAMSAEVGMESEEGKGTMAWIKLRTA